jgi:hypothetical protein
MMNIKEHGVKKTWDKQFEICLVKMGNSNTYAWMKMVNQW